MIQIRIAFASILCAFLPVACSGDESVPGPPEMIVDAQMDVIPEGGGSWLTGTVLKWEEAAQPQYMPRSTSADGTRLIYILHNLSEFLVLIARAEIDLPFEQFGFEQVHPDPGSRNAAFLVAFREPRFL